MTINELLGQLDGLGLIVAPEIDTALNMPVSPHDVGAILLHLLAPTASEGYKTLCPSVRVPNLNSVG